MRLLVLLLLICHAGPARAAESPMLPGEVYFSGLLAAGSGFTGVAGVTFSLYAGPSGGAALWTETQNVNVAEGGGFTVLLGKETLGGIPREIFSSNEARWLEVSYTSAEGQAVAQPRVLLVSVPYALKAGDADTLGGLPATAFLRAALDGGPGPGAASSRLGGDAPPSAAVGTPGLLGKFAANGVDLVDSALRESGGRLGLNTLPDYVIDLNAGAGEQTLLRFFRPGENIFTMTADASENSKLVLADGAGIAKLLLGTASGDFRIDMNADAGAQSVIRVFRPGENIFNLSTDANEHASIFVSNGLGSTTIKFNTAGDSFFTSGSVGIGTALPSAMLDVAGTVKANGILMTTGAGAGKLLTSDASGNASWQFAPVGNIGGSGTANRVPRFTAATTLGDSLLWDNGTNVGLNTAVPLHKLDIQGAGNFDSSLRIGNSAASGSGFIRLQRTAGSLNNWDIGYDAAAGGAARDFYIHDNIGPGTRLLIDANGQVGIGTTSPGALLHVQMPNSSPITSGAVLNVAGGKPPAVSGLGSTGSGIFLTGGNGGDSSNEDGGAGGSITLQPGAAGAGSGGFNLGAGNVLLAPNGTGSVAIGQAAPNNRLSVNGNANISGTLALGTVAPQLSATLQVKNAANNGGIIQVGGNAVDGLSTRRIQFGDAALVYVGETVGTDDQMEQLATTIYMNTLAVGIGIGPAIGLGTLQVGGDIRVGNSGTNGCLKRFDGAALIGTCASDARFKRDIRPLGSMLDRVTRLEPVSYLWRADEFPERGFGRERVMGLIAQQVEEVLPELVSAGEDGYKRVSFTELPLLAIQAVKELKAENDSLRAEVESLRRELAGQQGGIISKTDAQEARLQALEALLEQRLGVPVSQTVVSGQ